MSAALALALADDPTLQPDPGRDDERPRLSIVPPAEAMPEAPAAPAPAAEPTRAAPAPSRIRRVLTVVRALLGYATMLTGVVREHPSAALSRLVGEWFETPDPALVLRRLMRGLIRAQALEAWLRQRAEKGHDLPPSTCRMPPVRKPRGADPLGRPAGDARRPAKAKAKTRDAYWLPTREEAEAEVRRRPIGVVLAAICADLGVMYSDLDPASWTAIKDVILLYGGSAARLLINRMRRVVRVAPEQLAPAMGLPPVWLAPGVMRPYDRPP